LKRTVKPPKLYSSSRTGADASVFLFAITYDVIPEGYRNPYTGSVGGNAMGKRKAAENITNTETEIQEILQEEAQLLQGKEDYVKITFSSSEAPSSSQQGRRLKRKTASAP